MEQEKLQGIPVFESLHGNSPAQRHWKWLSLMIHFALWLTFVMPNASGLIDDPGRLMAASQMESKAIRVFVPVAKKEKKLTHEPSEDGLFDSNNGADQDIAINLKGLQLNVRNDPTFEMLKVLRRQEGLIGCATAITPRSLELVFGIGDSDNGDGDRSWSHYFPLRFRKFRVELPAAYKRCADSTMGSDTIGYALFPKRFEKELEM